jgi:hypothetical protein
MFAPGATVAGKPVFVTDRSASSAATVVVAVALSLPPFGSATAPAMVAVFVITVAPGVPASTATASVNTSLPAFAKVAMLHVTVPVPPTAGVTQDQPAGVASDWKVVPAGSGSVIVTVVESFGPLLLAVMV